MKKFLVFLLAALLLMSLGCSESKQDQPESKATIQEEPKKPAESEAACSDSVFNFDTDEIGKMPEGWSNYVTGKGGLGKWEVRQDNDTRVLAQVSQENFGYHFDVIVRDESDYQDLEIIVKFKGVKGEEDQGGGPVWRYQDADNYYIARANPLENNYRVYKVVQGKRKQLVSAKIDIPTGKWFTLKIRMAANHIECYYDGKKHLDVTDDTFKAGGKVGLWTKADAFTYFDDLKIIRK